MSSIVPLRFQAFQKQNCKCFYCGLPVWVKKGKKFARCYQLPVKRAAYLKCTAEHLVARQDGGADTAENVVAACLWCNKHRHHRRPHNAPDANTYKRRVEALIARGNWHPAAPHILNYQPTQRTPQRLNQ